MASSFSGKVKFLKRKVSSLLFVARQYRERLNDRIYGLDFAAPVSREDAGIDRMQGSQYYGSTGFAPELRDALTYLHISPEDRILDYGCGKGAALVTFTKYPFRKVAGVELSESLTEICRSNMKKLKLENVKIINGDATEFFEIDEFTCFYMANPFIGDVFQKVINNIIASGKRKTRRLAIIYYNPKCHDIVEGSGQFTLVKQFNYGARRLFIYLMNQS